MKKILLVFVIATAGALNSYGFGIGVEGGFGGGWGTGGYGGGNVGAIGLSLGFGDVSDPMSLLGVSFSFRSSGWGLAGHYDFSLINLNITNWFALYINVGVGLNFGWWNYNNHSNWNLGVVGRIPLGMRFIVINHLEFFAEVTPNIGLGMGSRSKTNDQGSFGLGFIGGVGGTFGLRYWL